MQGEKYCFAALVQLKLVKLNPSYLFLVKNLSAGRAERASFITLSTKDPTCFEISGLSSANTSCELSFKKVLTLCPTFFLPINKGMD